VGVQKAIDLIGTGDSIQDAVTEALDRARLSLEGITSFEVQRISGVDPSGRSRAAVHRHRAHRSPDRQGDPGPPAPAGDLRDARAHRLLRWSGAVERRTRPDGVYEWYSTSDGPLEVRELLAGG
jgi:flavin-binding protein dodecin